MNCLVPGPDASDRPSRRPALVWVYFVLAGAGLVGTWYFNLTYDGANYVGDWFANRASSSAAVDLVVLVVVAGFCYVRESRRLGWRAYVPVVFTVLSVVVALSFALPLFLGLRERRLQALAQDEDPRP